MMFSTRGRYALRVMIDLAENYSDAYIPLKEISQRQQISLKYLESIMSVLSKADYVNAVHGKGGGYRLSRNPNEYTAAGILELTDGSLSPVACIENGKSKCTRAEQCKTLPMWEKLDEIINGYLSGITLSDLTNQ